ncbi:MAG: hypothetical protein MUF25_16945 [Pirellulaceae bacterium]|jgi:hypothetical protein|nr:hypothetical protein [Pirellulaceae bacterium]
MVARFGCGFSLLAVSVFLSSGCTYSEQEIIRAYQLIVNDYHTNRLDEFYDRIEPETQRLLDHTTRGLVFDPELKRLEGRELFKAHWGKDKRPKIYPMWMLVPGEVTHVSIHGDVAELTVRVDRNEVLPSVQDTRSVVMVKHAGVWKLSAAQVTKNKLQLVYPAA